MIKLVVEYNEAKDSNSGALFVQSIKVKNGKEVIVEESNTDVRGIDRSEREAFIAKVCNKVAGALKHQILKG